jgi:diguanylate cyclase (GGDEF)-like protein
MAITGGIAITVLPFMVYRFSQHDWVTAVIDVLIFLAMTTMFLQVFYNRKLHYINTILPLVALLGVSAIIFLKGEKLIYWVFPSIVGMFYLFPIKKALAYSILFYFSALYFIYPLLDLEHLFIVFVTLALTCVFSYIFSKNAKYQNDQLVRSSQISRLRSQSLELIVRFRSLNDILECITHNIEKEFPNVRCSILLLDESGKHLLTGAAPSLPDFYNEAVNNVEIGLGVGSCGTATYLGERVIVEDIMSHPYWEKYKDLAKKAHLASCWSEPIKDSTGKVLGSFAMYHHEKSSPTASDLELIEQFAYLSSISIERERANKLIWHQANFDSLTGLPNRNMMVEHLQQAIKVAQRTDKKIMIAFLDLDNFKDVNDNLGHEKGDLLLIEAANRIKNSVREQDMVARLGGDEFVIILNDIEQQDGVNIVATKLVNCLSEPYHLDDEVVYSSASIGFTLFPDDSTEIDLLLKNADQAMYGAKNAGRNQAYFFTENMRAAADKRLELIQDLRKAIENNEFFVVYQPIICLKEDDIFKAEALIRWKHPDKGIINPLDFISIAEETGLLIEISDLLFMDVIEQVLYLRKNFNDKFQISINTSPVQYKKNSGNISNWLNYLNEHNIPVDAIALEITENLLMSSQAGMKDSLDAVRQASVDLSIDDFGTGYSSFSYLREYKTEYLKIDKSFVQKMSYDNADAALCEAIIMMAKKLNIQVIAEGIETEAQKSLLATFGCDFGQGYLLSKPLSSNNLTEFLKSNSAIE